MSHSNGKIYRDTSGATPIGIDPQADVDVVLVRATGDYGQLCGDVSPLGLRLNAVNKFAKYKPIQANTVGNLTGALRKAALHGFGPNGLPVYTSAAALTAALRSGVTAGAHWLYAPPTTRHNLLDFDGYVHVNWIQDEWGTLGPDGATALNFPFGGKIITSDAPLGPYSAIVSAVLDWEDPELHPSGLLYPSDFAGTDVPLTEWYFGLLLVPTTIPSSGNVDLWIVTCADKVKEDDNALSNIPLTQGESTTSIGLGYYNLFPIICSRPHNNAGNPVFQNFKNSWSGEGGGPGKLVLLDGYRLPVQLVAVSEVLEITFTMTGSTQVNVVIKNKLTRFTVTVIGNQMFGYLMSGYVAGRTMSEDVEDAADDWIDNGSEYTAGVKNSSNQIIGRYIDFFSAFRTANGNSSVIAAGATITFSVAVGASADGLGKSYGADSEMYYCYEYAVQGHANVKTYELLEQ